jgi:hypothetical protein
MAVAPTKSSAGFIYILRPRVTLDGREVIKIGMTTSSVDRRVRQLRTGSMVPFDVVYSLRVENARNLERALHQRFQARRAVGGGGQEFFYVPAEEVIAEVERIATDVSRERARAARDRELRDFRNKIGASSFETVWIGFPLAVLALSLWFLLTVIFVRVAQGAGIDVFLTAIWGGLILSPLVTSLIVGLLNAYLMSLLYEPRFGAAIKAKHEELRIKYPLAYS